MNYFTSQRILSQSAVALALVFLTPSPGFAEEVPEAIVERTAEEIEQGVRLQIFLDHAGFSPGKIDGRPGEFTHQALTLYREANGNEVPQNDNVVPGGAPGHSAENADQLPDVSDLDLAGVNPVFIEHTVTEEDLKHVGNVPSEVEAKAELDFLPYHSALDALAEQFHTDKKFIEEMNQGKTSNISAGDVIRVPNVQPFNLAAFIEAAQAAEIDVDQAPRTDKTNKDAKEEVAPIITTKVRIDRATNMLKIYEKDILVGAYPATIGSGQTRSPAGDWKVTAIAMMPTFRHDKSMLKHGERSGDFHMLPPGPANPVGVLWVQLDKKGIGIHGTEDPDSIGRSASAGCVRLANWDVVRLMDRIQINVPVNIE